MTPPHHRFSFLSFSSAGRAARRRLGPARTPQIADFSVGCGERDAGHVLRAQDGRGGAGTRPPIIEEKSKPDPHEALRQYNAAKAALHLRTSSRRQSNQPQPNVPDAVEDEGHELDADGDGGAGMETEEPLSFEEQDLIARRAELVDAIHKALGHAPISRSRPFSSKAAKMSAGSPLVGEQTQASAAAATAAAAASSAGGGSHVTAGANAPAAAAKPKPHTREAPFHEAYACVVRRAAHKISVEHPYIIEDTDDLKDLLPLRSPTPESGMVSAHPRLGNVVTRSR